MIITNDILAAFFWLQWAANALSRRMSVVEYWIDAWAVGGVPKVGGNIAARAHEPARGVL